MTVTTDLAEVTCRHCLRSLGLLAPIHGRGFPTGEDEDTDHYAEGREEAEAGLDDEAAE